MRIKSSTYLFISYDDKKEMCFIASPSMLADMKKTFETDESWWEEMWIDYYANRYELNTIYLFHAPQVPELAVLRIKAIPEKYQEMVGIIYEIAKTHLRDGHGFESIIN